MQCIGKQPLPLLAAVKGVSTSSQLSSTAWIESIQALGSSPVQPSGMHQGFQACSSTPLYSCFLPPMQCEAPRKSRAPRSLIRILLKTSRQSFVLVLQGFLKGASLQEAGYCVTSIFQLFLGFPEAELDCVNPKSLVQAASIPHSWCQVFRFPADARLILRHPSIVSLAGPKYVLPSCASASGEL